MTLTSKQSGHLSGAIPAYQWLLSYTYVSIHQLYSYILSAIIEGHLGMWGVRHEYMPTRSRCGPIGRSVSTLWFTVVEHVVLSDVTLIGCIFRKQEKCTWTIKNHEKCNIKGDDKSYPKRAWAQTMALFMHVQYTWQVNVGLKGSLQIHLNSTLNTTFNLLLFPWPLK